MEPIVVEPALGTLEWKETNLKKQLSKKIKYILITFDEGQPAAVEPVLEWHGVYCIGLGMQLQRTRNLFQNRRRERNVRKAVSSYSLCIGTSILL